MSPTDLPTRAPVVDPAYGLSVLGALFGGGAGGGVGGALGLAYTSRFMPNAELEGIVPPTVGAILGIWLGAVLGAWAFLALRHRVAARSTGFLLAGALPAWGIVSLPSFFWLLQQLSGNSSLVLLELALPLVILCVPPALAARALVVHRERLNAKREETSL